MPAASAIKVLVVDDQLTMRALIRSALQEIGIRDIADAGDGEEGIKSLLGRPAHLVISDFNMPKMDGLGFLRAVRVNEATKKSALHHAHRTRRQRPCAACDSVRREQLHNQTVFAGSASPKNRRSFRASDMSHVAAIGHARERTMHVVQGEYRVINDPRVVLTTILGSCVATCIWDEVAGVGGMNHFLLPGDDGAASDQVKYGVNAMELLINGLLKAGASRARMRAKLFGGAHVVQSLGDIGAKNAAFAQRFLALEGISCVGQSLGGDRARRVRFWPTTGRASQLLLEATQASELLAERQLQPTPVDPSAGKVELF